MSDCSLNKPAGNFHFDAVLYPQRSLSQTGFHVIMMAYIAAGAILGGFFWAQGAWPITLLFVPALLLVWGAFKANFRSGRMFETIRISENELLVEEHRANGQVRRWAYNPAWVRVELEEQDENHNRLCLMSSGEGIEVGAFLNAQERRDLAAALRKALHGP